MHASESPQWVPWGLLVVCGRLAEVIRHVPFLVLGKVVQDFPYFVDRSIDDRRSSEGDNAFIVRHNERRVFRSGWQSSSACRHVRRRLGRADTHHVAVPKTFGSDSALLPVQVIPMRPPSLLLNARSVVLPQSSRSVHMAVQQLPPRPQPPPPAGPSAR